MTLLWNCAAGHQLMIINQSSYLHAGLHECVKLGTWFETVPPNYFQLVIYSAVSLQLKL